jgi:hypothetical protein
MPVTTNCQPIFMAYFVNYSVKNLVMIVCIQRARSVFYFFEIYRIYNSERMGRILIIEIINISKWSTGYMTNS